MMKRYPIQNMQALEIVEYLEENGLYYQLYTDKGVYVPDYGVESVRNEIEYVKNSKENFDLKELETIADYILSIQRFIVRKVVNQL